MIDDIGAQVNCYACKEPHDRYPQHTHIARNVEVHLVWPLANLGTWTRMLTWLAK